MNRLTFAAGALAATLLLPTAAVAKGPSGASISGPSLGKPLQIGGNGEATGTALGDLTVEAGFFPAAFEQQPNPMLQGRPRGKLGPKFTIRYLVPGPNGRSDRISQDLYPYARVGAVTYMKPGQPVFGTTTRGGWFAGGSALRRTLVQAGLPARAPRASSGASLAVLAGLGIPGALVLAGAAVFVTLRGRRAGRPA